MAEFIIQKSTRGQFYYTFRGSNHEVVMTGEEHTTKAACQGSIASVKVNAPHDEVNELDVGVEWQPWPELELTALYTHTFRRTNTRVAPYNDTESADRLAFQAQINF